MFYVMNEEGFPSLNDVSESSEVFETQQDAISRAEELAAENPGCPFFVTQAIAAVECPVGEPEIEELN